jgi:NTE family protein
MSIGRVLKALLFRDWRAPGVPQAIAKLGLATILLLGVAAALVAGAYLVLAVLVLTLLTFAFAWLVSVIGAAGPEGPAAVTVEMPSSSEADPTEDDVACLLGPFNTERRYDGVFEGGGVKAIAQIGAIRRMEEWGLTPYSLAGTSGGAIIASGLAAGGDARQLWAILTGLDLTSILDARWFPNTPLYRRPFYGIVPLLPALTVRFGAVRGDDFLALMERELKQISGRDHLSFGDLETELRGVATDITRKRALVLPDDITGYCVSLDGDCAECEAGGACLTPDGLSVPLAVRMSIPFLFEPVRLRHKASDVTCLIVDGGVSSNYPIWLFDAAHRPSMPTIGLLLDEQKEPGLPFDVPKQPREIRSMFKFAGAVVGAGIGAIDRIQSPSDHVRSMRIGTLNVDTTDFGLDEERQAALFEEGYSSAEYFLRGFDWAAYVTEFRGGVASFAPGTANVPASGEATVDEIAYGRREPGSD